MLCNLQFRKSHRFIEVFKINKLIVCLYIEKPANREKKRNENSPSVRNLKGSFILDAITQQYTIKPAVISILKISNLDFFFESKTFRPPALLSASCGRRRAAAQGAQGCLPRDGRSAGRPAPEKRALSRAQ